MINTPEFVGEVLENLTGIHSCRIIFVTVITMYANPHICIKYHTEMHASTVS